jgi:DNA-binding NarL/FixJ family response regulator
VARAGDGVAALEQLSELRPDLAVIDIRMPKLDGCELVRRARLAAPATRIVVYTGYADPALVAETVDAGAVGFLLKESPIRDLARAVATVAEGRMYLDPVLAGAVMAAAQAPAPQLTQRERDVLRLLSTGLIYDDIAALLFLSPETVRKHVRNATGKLGAATKTEAVARALRQHVIA